VKNKKYYLGLDIGTDSIGYAVTTPDYNLIKFKGEPMWGTHLFEAAEQMADRRSFRTARRRLDRRQQRVRLLQELFADEINKIDSKFYVRLKESALWQEDKTEPGNKSSIFYKDPYWTDKHYHDEYPTVHHLINDLMTSDEKKDIRLVYMACAWLVAHRGHFLSPIDGENIEQLTEFDPIYDDFISWLNNNLIDKPWNDSGNVIKEMTDILSGKGNTTYKKSALTRILFGVKKPKDDPEEYPFSKSAMVDLLAGGSVQIKKIFIADESVSEINESISLSEEDDSIAAKIAQLGDNGGLIIRLKAMYDCALLSRILAGVNSVSEAKIKIYDDHKSDLAKLKYIIRKYRKDKYRFFFREDVPNSYTSYVGHFVSNKSNCKKTSKEDFHKEVKKITSKLSVRPEDSAVLKEINEKIESGTFLPKQVDTDNRVIPHQLYYHELKLILEKASVHYDFLNSADEDGLSVKEKIKSIFNFRIPYYVGPLNSHSNFAWLERKAEGKIYPWNFDELIDRDASEQQFINRMTNQCTYLPDEDVLPKWSLLYCKFNVLNEINNIKINGRPISVETKQGLYNEVFKPTPENSSRSKVTVKKIRDYLISGGIMSKNEKDLLSGIDIDIKSNLKPYFDFNRLLSGKVLTEGDVDKIIAHSTYTEDRERYKKWLKSNYSNLSDSDINYVSRLKYSDFGRLSDKLLNRIEGTNKTTGETGTIIHFLWNTNDNLMEIIADPNRYTFADVIRDIRNEYYAANPMTFADKLESFGLSNAVKRPVIRTMDIVTEITKVMKSAPEKIFVEMARGATAEQKNKRTVSRKDQLIELYKQIKNDDSKRLTEELEKLGDDADNRLQSQKLYLYYLQMGRCMYCGEPIDLASINNEEYYDIDHIWPQSYVKDDSILNNKVLVHSKENSEKEDKYPLPAEWRSRMRPFWEMLRENKLITEEKYKRLVRTTGFTDDEKLGFINRQLVETRQSTKAVTEILRQSYPDSEIVFVKAGLVSDFRHEYGEIKNKVYQLEKTNDEIRDMQLVKCRSINDTHHANDAYLNIVVGNVYHEKFTSKWFNVSTDRYSMNYPVLFGKEVKGAWEPQRDLATVDKVMANPHIHLTKYQTCQKGGFFDQMPVKAGTNPDLIPRKKGLDTEKYGGYNKPTASFFVLVGYTNKKKKELTFLFVDLLVADKFMADDDFAFEYIREKLGDKISDIFYPLGKRKIKINTVISLDGFEVCISGKDSGGAKIVLRSLTTAFYDRSDILYIKKIENVSNKIKENGDYSIHPKYDGIDAERSLELFDKLIGMQTNPIFGKMPCTYMKTTDDTRDKFVSLTMKEQIIVLSVLVDQFKTNRAAVCDMTLVGGVKSTGKLTLSSNVSNWLKKYNDIRIIDRSASGLREERSRNLREFL